MNFFVNVNVNVPEILYIRQSRLCSGSGLSCMKAAQEHSGVINWAYHKIAAGTRSRSTKVPFRSSNLWYLVMFQNSNAVEPIPWVYVFENVLACLVR